MALSKKRHIGILSINQIFIIKYFISITRKIYRCTEYSKQLHLLTTAEKLEEGSGQSAKGFSNN